MHADKGLPETHPSVDSFLLPYHNTDKSSRGWALWWGGLAPAPPLSSCLGASLISDLPKKGKNANEKKEPISKRSEPNALVLTARRWNPRKPCPKTVRHVARSSISRPFWHEALTVMVSKSYQSFSKSPKGHCGFHDGKGDSMNPVHIPCFEGQFPTTALSHPERGGIKGATGEKEKPHQKGCSGTQEEGNEIEGQRLSRVKQKKTRNKKW